MKNAEQATVLPVKRFAMGLGPRVSVRAAFQPPPVPSTLLRSPTHLRHTSYFINRLRSSHFAVIVIPTA